MTSTSEILKWISGLCAGMAIFGLASGSEDPWVFMIPLSGGCLWLSALLSNEVT